MIAYGTLTAATAQSVNLSSIDKYAAFTFDGVQNEYLSLQLASFISSNDSVSVHVYGPLNTAIATAMLSSSQRTMHLPRLTQAGTYSVYFGSGGGTHQFSVTLERNQLIPADGVTVNVASSLSQTKRLLFAAVAGQTVGLGVTGISLDPNGYILFDLIQPNGTSVSGWFACDGNVSTPGCSFNFRNLTQSGIYQIIAWPNLEASMSLGVALSPAVTGTPALNTPQSLNLNAPGKVALYTFTATSGQTVAFNASSIATAPADKAVTLTAYDPAGNQIDTVSSTSNATLNLSNLAAGTYSVLVSVADAATSTMQVTLASGMGGALPMNGTTANVAATVLNQRGEFTFAATAGQTIGLGVTSISLDPNGYILFNLIQPDGNSLSGWFACDGNVSSPGCSFNFRDLPATGTYRLTAWPNIPSLMSFGLTLSPAVTGTPALNTPQSLNLNAPGKVALYTFTATSGQTVAFNASSIATAPADKAVTLTAYDPAGNQIDTVSSTSNATLNLSNLAAGTYSVLVSVADAATGSMQLIRQ